MQVTYDDKLSPCAQHFEDVLAEWFDDAKRSLVHQTKLFMRRREMEICARFDEESRREKANVPHGASHEGAQDLASNADTANRSVRIIVSLDDDSETEKHHPASTRTPSKDWSAKDTLPSIQSKFTGATSSRALSSKKNRHSTCSFKSYEVTGLEEELRTRGKGSTASVQTRMQRALHSTFLGDSSCDDLDALAYHVEDLYKTTGFAQALARSEIFIHFTQCVIVANAIYMGVDADWNDADTLYNAEVPFIVAENLFCFYFVFEWFVRLHAFGRKRDSWKDGWFRFDSCLVVLTVGETWILAPILARIFNSAVGVPVAPVRLMRLARFTRITRLMRFFPELVTMTRGMLLGVRALASALLMTLFMVYSFSILLNMSLKQQESINTKLSPRNFSSIGAAMFTLLIDGTFMDSPGKVLQSLFLSGTVSGVIGCVIFLLFIFVSAFTTVNMLIGIICEVVNTVYNAEKEGVAIMEIKSSVLVHLLEFDDGDKMISHHEFLAVLSDKNAKRAFELLNIDRLFLLQLKPLLFPKSDSVVAIKTVMEFILKCRADLPVTVQHIASAFAANLTMMQNFEDRLVCSLDRFEDRL